MEVTFCLVPMTRASVFHTVELQPVCSHPVFNIRKADGDGLEEVIKVLGLGAVIELSVVSK